MSNLLTGKSKVINSVFYGVVCVALLFGSVVNAAMPCCIAGDGASVVASSEHDSAMQHSDADMHDADAGMPCHEASDGKSQQTSSDCSDCDCQYCMKVTAIAPYKPSFEGRDIVGLYSITQKTYSRQPEAIYQPPKHSPYFLV